jgi:hypothetical protein
LIYPTDLLLWYAFEKGRFDMTAVTFDTLEYTEELKNAGVPEEQAKAQVRALSKALESKELATKSDLKETEKKLELKIAETETRLIKWMVATGLGTAGIIIATFLAIIKIFIPG